MLYLFSILSFSVPKKSVSRLTASVIMSDFWGIMYNCGVMLGVIVVYMGISELQSKQLRKLFLSIYIIYEFFLTMSSFFGRFIKVFGSLQMECMTFCHLSE